MTHEDYMREALILARACLSSRGAPSEPSEAGPMGRGDTAEWTSFPQRGKRVSGACIDDVPVGCVVVSPDGKIIGWGRNRREEAGRATAHAEIEAIDMACSVVGNWRLTDCTLYVTLEPCPMCAGAIINSRIGTVRYGAKEDKSGCCGSVLNLFEERFNHRPRVYGGLLEAECRALLEEFFQTLRKI